MYVQPDEIRLAVEYQELRDGVRPPNNARMAELRDALAGVVVDGKPITDATRTRLAELATAALSARSIPYTKKPAKRETGLARTPTEAQTGRRDFERTATSSIEDATAGKAGTVRQALTSGAITAERVADALSYREAVRIKDTARATDISNRLTEAGVGDLTRLTSEQLSDLYMRVVDGSWPRMQSVSEGRALTANEAAQRVDAVVRGAGGTFTPDRTDSPSIGTAKIGGDSQNGN